MINIITYRDYWESVKNRVAAIQSCLVVATEHQLGEKITNISEYPLLVAVIPSADPNSRDVDNVKEVNTGFIFVLKKLAESDKTDDSYLEVMNETQLAMQEVKNLVAADFSDCDAPGHEVMKRLDVSSFHQDPEYNYLGHDGWSLSFKFTSVGY